MQDTVTLGDKVLTLDEQIELAEVELERALTHLQELQRKQFDTLAANTDAAFAKVEETTKEMRKNGYL